MAKFVYQVRDAHGATASGVLVAADLAEAARTLRGEGNVIVNLREKTDAEAALPGRTGRKRIKKDDVIFFANQLAVMVDTGVPLAESLDAIAEQTESEGFRAVLVDVSDQVKAGTDFSASLARHPKIFGDLFVAMVQASEASGTMGKMLQRIAKYLEQQRRIVRRVKGAMAYPVGMLAFCVLVVVGMLVFILPRFQRIYAGRAAVLPGPTRALLALSRGLVSYWPIILGALAALVGAAWYLLRRPAGKVFADRLRINLPVAGKMFRRAAISRSLRTLSTMIATGVGVLDALQITAAVTGNRIYRDLWLGLCEKVKVGNSLSEEMLNYPLIPRTVTQMIAAGEKTGKLPTVLDRVSEFCEEELDVAIRTVLSFIEPAMIIIMGAFVGGIALAMLLPVMSLSKVMTH